MLTQRRLSEQVSASAPIQRYAVSRDSKYNVSENNQFAVSTEKYPSAIFTRGEAVPQPLPGGLKWKGSGESEIDGSRYTKYEADASEYEKENGPGSAKFCGELARGLTGKEQAEEQSKAEPGGVLYDKNTTPGKESGWSNHYAAVVLADGGDHATFETAVGIEHVWVGMYGSNRGQTFKYKTQVANIERLASLGSIVLPGKTRIEKGFWDYVLCRPGTPKVVTKETVVHLGISPEEAQQYQTEMTEWRDSGKAPASEYMKKIVVKLEAELESLQ